MKRNKALALTLALSMLLGTASVYADTNKKTEVNNKQVQEKQEKAEKTLNLADLKDDGAELAMTDEVNFSKEVPLDKYYHVSINGFKLYTSDMEKYSGDTIIRNISMYTDKKDKTTLMTPLRVPAEMMGAEFISQTDEKTVYKKDGKTFTFFSESKEVDVNGKKVKVRHNVECEHGVYYAPFYDLIKLFDMNIYVDFNEERVNSFDPQKKTEDGKDFLYGAQVIVWDKSMKLFKADNPAVEKFLKNKTSWYNKRKSRMDDYYNGKLQYVLVDTKSKPEFALIRKKDGSDKDFSLMTDKYYVRGAAALIKDGNIFADILGQNEMITKKYGHYVWNYRDGAEYKKDDSRHETVTIEDLKKAEFVGFHHYRNNILTVMSNPFLN